MERTATSRVLLLLLLLLMMMEVLVTSWGHAQESKLMPDYFNHPCVRECHDESEPMECEYRFVAESYHTLTRACYSCTSGNVTDCLRDHCVTANGFSRNIKTINRGLPGPTIQVCQGDTVVVNVENYFFVAEGLAVHWHGFTQRYTPHMDGVGMVTQCPVQAFSTFQYRFVALDSGTHFWHAHTGLQRAEGIFGSLVVRQPPSLEPHRGLYDFDLPRHVLIVNEWQNRPLDEAYTAFLHAGENTQVAAILINGRAQDPTGNLTLPRAEFEVEPGQRYRFRVINAGSLFCPIQISVDDHELTLIASDGRAFESFVVESFDTYSAERYDFILTTDQPAGSYWLRTRGSGVCGDLEELAVIRYLEGEGEDAHHPHPHRRHNPPSHLATKPTSALVKRFNHLPSGATPTTTGPLRDAHDQIVHMNALAPDDRSLTGKVDHQFLLDMALNEVDNLHFYDPDLYPPGAGPYPSVTSAQINGISNRLGPVPLLAQMDEIPPELFCNATSEGAGRECEREWCECVHKLTVLEGEVVEMVLISPSSFFNFTHPLHLHGYSYRVVAMDKGPEGIMTPELFREMDARGEIKRKLSRAPFKDTVPMTNGGYVILRLVADNPGVWFAHCHLQYHVEEGMSFSLEVLQSDGTLPPPPPDFPRCGPYVPLPPLSSHLRDEGPATAVGRAHQKATGNPHFPGTSFHHHHHDHYSPPQPGIDLSSWVIPALISMGILLLLLLLLLVLVHKLRRDNQRLRRHLCHVIGEEEKEVEQEGEVTLDDEQRPESGSDDFLWTPDEEKARLVG